MKLSKKSAQVQYKQMCTGAGFWLKNKVIGYKSSKYTIRGKLLNKLIDANSVNGGHLRNKFQFFYSAFSWVLG